MDLLLDTCTLLALSEGSTIRPATVEALARGIGASAVYYSAATIWELAQKASLGKLSFAAGRDARAFLAQAANAGGFASAPLGDEIMLEAYDLAGWDHRDPADRMIFATARWSGAVVVTSDRAILAHAATGAVEAMPL